MRSIASILGAIAALMLGAQGPVSISLQQALEMAAQQSYSVRASVLETEKARHRVKEITAIGLPQVNGEASMSDFIDVPTSLVPNFFTPPGPGVPEYFAASFAVPWNVTGGITVTQLLFDGSYIVGLQATRGLEEQSRLDLEKARADARNQAAKAYYGVLAAEEGVRLVNEGIPLLEKSLREVEAMKEAGFLEQTDADRISIQLEQARAQKRSFEQQASVARMLLALALGVPQGTPITLTDKLEVLLNDPMETALSEQGFDAGSHVEIASAKTLLRLQELNVRNEKMKNAPSLGGYFLHQQVWNGPEFDPGGTYRFYPTTQWGLKLSVPIFGSGSRYHKVKQAQAAMDQVELNRTATEQRLLAQSEQARTAARTAFDNLRTAERNMVLARNIFDRTTTKFASGTAASFELTQEQGNYLLAQQTYVQNLVQLLMARADLRKALDLY
ncbi:MAG: TolC family protein [Flavobacteriales bacterium]|nr:TolC family protein [Flavobacteriales bacterium]